jgi:hypothetical protein
MCGSTASLELLFDALRDLVNGRRGRPGRGSGRLRLMPPLAAACGILAAAARRQGERQDDRRKPRPSPGTDHASSLTTPIGSANDVVGWLRSPLLQPQVWLSDQWLMVDVDSERFEAMVSAPLDRLPVELGELGELISTLAVTVEHDEGPAPAYRGSAKGTPLTAARPATPVSCQTGSRPIAVPSARSLAATPDVVEQVRRTVCDSSSMPMRRFINSAFSSDEPGGGETGQIRHRISLSRDPFAALDDGARHGRPGPAYRDQRVGELVEAVQVLLAQGVRTPTSARSSRHPVFLAELQAACPGQLRRGVFKGAATPTPSTFSSVPIALTFVMEVNDPIEFGRSQPQAEPTWTPSSPGSAAASCSTSLPRSFAACRIARRRAGPGRGRRCPGCSRCRRPA